MQHFERSSATSVECCTVLSEYKTHALHAQILVNTTISKLDSEQLDKNTVFKFTGDAQKTATTRDTWVVMHVFFQAEQQLRHFHSAPQDRQIAS